MRVKRYSIVDSTNLEARRLADAGEQGPLWIIADAQTAGRGRLGRNWVSEPGNLFATLLLPVTAPESAYPQIGFVAALAVFEASTKFANPDAISLKWPNDCLLNGAKFCGILTETLRSGLLAVGIGINISHVPPNLPYPVSQLPAPNVESVFQALQASLSNYIEIWSQGHGFLDIARAWSRNCNHIGKTVLIDNIRGTFTGLAPDGAMVLELADGSLKRIYAGDVRVEYEPAR